MVGKRSGKGQPVLFHATDDLILDFGLPILDSSDRGSKIANLETIESALGRIGLRVQSQIENRERYGWEEDTAC